MKPRIAITLGDPAGIGPEIVAAAVRDRTVLRMCEPMIVGDPVAFALHKERLPQIYMLSVPGLRKSLPLGQPSVASGRSAMESLTQAIGLLRARQVQALVTAPVSKRSFEMAGFGFPGHTEWLAHVSKVSSIEMLMVAGHLRALLMTRHLPLTQVPSRLTPKRIEQAARAADAFVRHVLRKRKPKVVLCGINPHAGDGGILGTEEVKIYAPALRSLKASGIHVVGPFAADSVFRQMAAGDYDVALAAYHDQGMIPVKLFAPHHIVNISLGLPFIRTAPGHGTAYDIVGKRRADPGPMIEAIRLAALYSTSVVKR